MLDLLVISGDLKSPIIHEVEQESRDLHTQVRLWQAVAAGSEY